MTLVGFRKVRFFEKTIDILAYKMATNATVAMMTQNLYQLRQDNAIVPVLEIKTKYVVIHGDFLYMDRIDEIVK